MDSIWRETSNMPCFSQLDRDIHRDVLVIGGGMAGLLCAYYLKQAGVSYALVEAKNLCSGITQNTTAKITWQHGLIYHRLLGKWGQERAKMYYDANREAVESYRALAERIPCHWESRDAVVYTRGDRDTLTKELGAMERLGIPGTFVSHLPLPLEIAGGVRVSHQAQFHPLEFAAGISKELEIYEDTKVEALVGTTAVTNRGRIRAEKVIIATHFPFLNRYGSYFLKLYQHRSYVLALKNGPQVNGMYVDDAEKGMSFRNAGDRLLLGGGDHRTGKSGGGWRELSEFAEKHYPQTVETARWATQDCMSLDGVPYIGRYSARTPNLFVAAGFNKWGMTSAMAAAKILTDLVQGKESLCAPVFSPSRSILTPQLAVNGWEAVKNLCTLSPRRCPHMGCALKWNPEERSWDCPCHGSRFSGEGELLDNPADDDLPKRFPQNGK